MFSLRFFSGLKFKKGIFKAKFYLWEKKMLRKARPFLLTLFLISVVHSVMLAQTRATTEDGKTVILYDDGTWKYDSLPPKVADTGVVLSFTKPEAAHKLQKSEKIPAGIWYNDHKWKVKSSTSGEAYEYMFSLKSGDLYAMFIPERIEIPMDELVTIAKGNAEKVSTEFKEIKEGTRIINGVKMRYMEMKAKVHGIDLMYFGYYYSQKDMTIQFLGYTSESLFKENQAEIESMLNGLVILKQ
jgi:hypothetical protein